MGDLYIGLLIVAAMTLALFGAGRVVGRRSRPSVANGLGLLTVALLLIYIRYMSYQTVLAGLLPFSNIIVIGNWCPLLAGFLSGLVSAKAVIPPWRRGLTAFGLMFVGGYVTIVPLIGSAPKCRDSWCDGVCLQTTDQTCSPAAAATLLRLYGIEATEQEMAELCLTRQGTHWMGLYRGLKKKTSGTGWDVEVLSGTFEDLTQLNGPAILSVGLPLNEFAAPTIAERSYYQTELGWTPGRRHSVVLLGFVLDLVDMAEPNPEAAHERWTRQELKDLYLGQGMRLVRR